MKKILTTSLVLTFMLTFGTAAHAFNFGVMAMGMLASNNYTTATKPAADELGEKARTMKTSATVQGDRLDCGEAAKMLKKRLRAKRIHKTEE